MTKQINIRFRATLTAIALALFTAIAAGAALRKPLTPTDTTIGFNALDYVLQKPLPPHSFPDSARNFFRNSFITLEGGPQWLHKPNSFKSHTGVTGTGGITAGGWITRAHGLRLSVAGGWHSGAEGRLETLGIGIDYMMNLTGVLSGYDPSRRWEVIASAGGELLLQHGNGTYNTVGGGRLGLQVRWNASPSTFLYVEPRIGLYSDGLDRTYSWHRYDWRASFMIGLGYRIAPAWLRNRPAIPYESEGWRQNIFYGIGLTAGGIMHHNTFSEPRYYLGAGGFGFFGKMFNATSGFRFSVIGLTTGRSYKNDKGQEAHNGAIAFDAAYQFNLNSAFNGYDPRRRVELDLLAGPTISVPNHHSSKMYLGFGVGLQGSVKASDNWSLFIEPFLRLYGRQFAWHNNTRINPLATLSLGVRYNVGTYRSPVSGKSNYDANRADWLAGNDFFMNIAGGVSSRGHIRRMFEYRRSPAISLFVGKWFSPASAWRLGVNYNYRDINPRYMGLGASADYMLSLSSLSAGWNERRVLDISLLAGLDLGASHYSTHNHLMYGAHFGMQARFNISKRIGLTLEPQIGVKHIPDYQGGKWNGETRLLAGLVYKLGATGNRDATAPSKFRSYVSGAVGPAWGSETFLNSRLRHVQGALDVAVGCWFSPANALQAGLSWDNVNMSRGKINVATLHADYMLDLIQAMDPDRSRRFGIMPHVGGGIAFNEDGKYGWAARAGLRLNWRLNGRVDLFFDPTMNLWQAKLLNASNNHHQFAGTGQLLVGGAWRF